MRASTIYINELFICKCQMLTVNVKMLTAFFLEHNISDQISSDRISPDRGKVPEYI